MAFDAVDKNEQEKKNKKNTIREEGRIRQPRAQIQLSDAEETSPREK